MSVIPDGGLGALPRRASRAPVRVEPRSGWQPVDLAELWEYRDLLWILALRDVKVRYRQTVLGAAWAVLQPLLTMLVFSFFFGRLAGIPSDGVPYPLFSFCGLLPWQFFSNTLTQAGNSLVGSQNLISKVYFPRLAIPVSTLLTSLLDLGIQFTVLLLLLAWHRTAPSPAIVALPLFLLLLLCSALGAGLWLSALNVEYRDVRHAIPFLAQFWLFVTPVVYPSSLVGERWRWALGLNPMAGVVEGFRWALLPGAPLQGSLVAASVASSLLLLLTGLLYFRRMERSFADVV